MSIKKIEMFKCSDGTLCTSESEAIAWEATSTLWNKAQADYGKYDEVIFAYKDDFFQFLRDNKTEILEYLGV